jgi:hypothetical protein
MRPPQNAEILPTRTEIRTAFENDSNGVFDCGCCTQSAHGPASRDTCQLCLIVSAAATMTAGTKVLFDSRYPAQVTLRSC